MADEIKKKRMEIARKLAGQYDDVEDFEAAGGNLGDLPQVNAVTDDNSPSYEGLPNLYLPRKKTLSLDNIEVIRSLKGGETPDQALATAEEGLIDAERRYDHISEARSKDWEEKIYPALDELLTGSGLRGGEYHPLGKLQEMGLIKMSPELEKLVGAAVKGDTGSSEAYFRVDEIENLIEDLGKFNRENTPFGQRAKEFQKRNPGKPYREEGGE